MSRSAQTVDRRIRLLRQSILRNIGRMTQEEIQALVAEAGSLIEFTEESLRMHAAAYRKPEPEPAQQGLYEDDGGDEDEDE